MVFDWLYRYDDEKKSLVVKNKRDPRLQSSEALEAPRGFKRHRLNNDIGDFSHVAGMRFVLAA